MKKIYITAAAILLIPTLPTSAEKPRGGGTDSTTYASWAAEEFEPEEMSQPSISGKLADPDGDGLTNFMEYALDGDPTYPDRIEVEPSATIADNKLAMEFKRDTSKSDVQLTVETSADLKNWRPLDSALISTRESLEKRRASVSIDEARSSFLRLRLVEM